MCYFMLINVNYLTLQVVGDAMLKTFNEPLFKHHFEYKELLYVIKFENDIDNIYKHKVERNGGIIGSHSTVAIRTTESSL